MVADLLLSDADVKLDVGRELTRGLGAGADPEVGRKAAEDHARRLVDEQEVVRIAKARSNELLTTAEQKSRELRRVANEYVDDALRRTEEAVAAALDEVRQSRIRFRNAAGAHQTHQIRQIYEEELEE